MVMEGNDTDNLTDNSLQINWIIYAYVEFHSNIPVWAVVLEQLFLSVIAIFGSIGNGMIIVVQCFNAEKSSTDILVLTMALFELLCSGFNAPMAFVRNLRSFWAIVGNSTLCSINVFSWYTTSVGCTLLLAAIAVDRYVHTCKPFSHFFSKRKAKWTSVSIVFISILVSSPMLVHTIFDEYTLKCENESGTASVTVWIQFSTLTSFCFMFIIVLFCYTNVSLVLRRQYHKKKQIACILTSKSANTVFETSKSSVSNVLHFSRLFTKSSTNGQLENLEEELEDHGGVYVGPSELKTARQPLQDEGKEQTSFRKSQQSTESGDIFVTKFVGDDGISTNNKRKDGHEPGAARLASSKSLDCFNAKREPQTNGETELDNGNIQSHRMSVQGPSQLQREQKLVNRTTAIMFLITLVYILSWVVFWLATGFSSKVTYTGLLTRYLFKYVYAVNCMTNPIFFMLLSSKFRKKANELFKQF